MIEQKLTDSRVGLLINFNVPVLKQAIKRLVRWNRGRYRTGLLLQ